MRSVGVVRLGRRAGMAVLCGLAASAEAASDYQVARVAGSDSALQITLTLPPSGFAELRRLQARGVDQHVPVHVESPRCGTFDLQQDDYGYWLAPPGCREVSWTVRAPAQADGEVGAAQQSSVTFAGGRWLLLSEPASLLRVVHGEARSPSLASRDPHLQVLGATPSAKGGWQLPAPGSPGGLYVVGEVPSERRQVGAFSVRYVAEDLPRVRQLGWITAHGTVLRSLAQTVDGAATPTAAQRDELVVWTGVDPAHWPAQDAADARRALTRYVSGQRPDGSRQAASALVDLAREQFLRLAQARRGDRPALPGWVRESLAQYYALNAVQSAIGDSPAFVQLRERLIDDKRPVTQHLPAVEPLFETDRPQAVALARTQGARFWAALDRRLAALSDGSLSLAQYLPDLLQMDFPDDATLPDAFVSRMLERHDQGLARLLAPYAGKQREKGGARPVDE